MVLVLFFLKAFGVVSLLLASCFEESRKLVGACILSLYSSLYFFTFSGSGGSNSPYK